MSASMPRQARLVVPGLPHHVTQRGLDRQPTFFEETDYRLYLDLLTDAARRAEVSIWSYCLMPNHVHLILVPADDHGLRLTLGETHRRYTAAVNRRMETDGKLWQGRFASVAMDEVHLNAALRYVALNPVRARLVANAVDWRWSNSRALLAAESDGVVDVAPVLARTGDFAHFLGEDCDLERAFASLRRAERTGRL